MIKEEQDRKWAWDKAVDELKSFDFSSDEFVALLRLLFDIDQGEKTIADLEDFGIPDKEGFLAQWAIYGLLEANHRAKQKCQSESN